MARCRPKKRRSINKTYMCTRGGRSTRSMKRDDGREENDDGRVLKLYTYVYLSCIISCIVDAHVSCTTAVNIL